MAPPLPAPFSTAGTATLPTSTAAYVPAPPEHVAIDIPSAAAAAIARLIVVKEAGVRPTPPPPQPERAAIDTPAAGARAKKKPPTTTARPDPFVRTLVKAMWVAYLLTLAPAALVGSAVVYGGDALLLVFGVFFLGVITGALFHVREEDDDDKEPQAALTC